MSIDEAVFHTDDGWLRAIRVLRGLPSSTDVPELARSLVESVGREFHLPVVQVWMRSGETGRADIGRGYPSEELELLAERCAEPPVGRSPSRLTVHDSLSGFVVTEGVAYRWRLDGPSPAEWEDARWAAGIGLRSGLAVPLVVQNRFVGTLTLWETERETSAFPEGLARLLAEYVSLALTQLRRLHKGKRQVQWLGGLQQVTGLLASHLSLDELCRLVFEQVASILPLSGFSINLHDEDSGILDPILAVAKVGERFEFRERAASRPFTGTLWERVILTREPMLLNRQPRARESVSLPAASDWGEKTGSRSAPISLMFAPMMLGENILGVLSVQSDLPNAYDQEALDLLVAVAKQTALAIENARLLDRLECQIRETQNANQLKSQFVANISHELRTPLNSIVGFTRIVRRQAAAALPDIHLRNLEYVLRSADHLLRIIDDLLDLSRLETGQLHVRLEPVDLSRLVARTLGELEVLIEESGCELAFDLDPALTQLLTDPTRVRQVLLNLVSNSLKFAGGAPVRVETGILDSPAPPDESDWFIVQGGRVAAARTGAGIGSERAPGDEARPPSPPPNAPPPNAPRAEQGTPAWFYIEVADSGPGIEADQFPAMFEEFRQGSTGNDRLHAGVGLGLAIVRRLVELLGGSLWAWTRPGEGCRVRAVMVNHAAHSRLPTPFPRVPSSRCDGAADGSPSS